MEETTTNLVGELYEIITPLQNLAKYLNQRFQLVIVDFELTHLILRNMKGTEYTLAIENNKELTVKLISIGNGTENIKIKYPYLYSQNLNDSTSLNLFEGVPDYILGGDLKENDEFLNGKASANFMVDNLLTELKKYAKHIEETEAKLTLYFDELKFEYKKEVTTIFEFTLKEEFKYLSKYILDVDYNFNVAENKKFNLLRTPVPLNFIVFDEISLKDFLNVFYETTNNLGILSGRVTPRKDKEFLIQKFKELVDTGKHNKYKLKITSKKHVSLYKESANTYVKAKNLLAKADLNVVDGKVYTQFKDGFEEEIVSFNDISKIVL